MEVIFQRWIPQKDLLGPHFLKSIITSPLITDILQEYLISLKPLNEVIYDPTYHKEAISSGAMCFFALTLLALDSDLTLDITKLSSFTNIYILVDYYLDNDDILENEKRALIKDINDFLCKKRRINYNNELTELVIYYLQLVISDDGNIRDSNNTRDNNTNSNNTRDNNTNSNNTRDNNTNSNNTSGNNIIRQIIKLFYVEVDSLKVQSNEVKTYQDYYSLACYKGGVTLETAKILLGGLPDENDHLLGACIQLVDDFLDLEEDLRDNIITPVTWIVKHESSLDNYVTKLVQDIDNIRDKVLFKIGLISLVIHGISRFPQYFSSSIIKLASKYDWLPPMKLSTIFGQELLRIIN